MTFPRRNPHLFCARLAAALAASGCIATAQAAVTLSPQFASTVTSARGADAEFFRIANDWHGSSVLWDEANGRFGSGEPIGSFAWGSGLWGRADWDTVQRTAAGDPGGPALVERFSGIGATINYANNRYNECHSALWGAAELVPFFTPGAGTGGSCGDPEGGSAEEQNWTSRFWGYIRITEPGEYNFGVLHDDGFFFRLIGAGGAEVGIERDFLNPRDRVGFGENLLLSAGLYGFELGMWNRLGAGVVDLRWKRENTEWELVPTDSLVPGSAIAEPGTWALLALSLGLGWRTRRVARRPA